MKVAYITGKNKGGGVMKRIFKGICADSKGFTLVELLIVIAILGVLAGVVLISAGGFADEGETEAALTEKVTVQTAVDAMIAKNSLSGVTATSATSNMSAFPTGNVLYPTYLRTATTTGTYSCDSTGLVTQATSGY